MVTTTRLSEFAKDTLKGLTAPNKYLYPKYFYDENGSRIFQQIMRMPEYYLTNCELDIFTRQSKDIAEAILAQPTCFNLIELGPGDGLKSKVLLKVLFQRSEHFSYMPIDISRHAISILADMLTEEIPGLHIQEHTGDYFQVMHGLIKGNGVRKVILFLGSTIGNFSPDELDGFLVKLSSLTATGDQVLIGFDLKKSPEIICRAYDDPHGYTSDFNLNHLLRINRELGADFNPDNFLHHATYNPVSGGMKSYLLSKCAQKVRLEKLHQTISFKPWESIFMELSKKFDISEIESLASKHGFEVLHNFTDDKAYFADSLWVKGDTSHHPE
jgi:L-histidine Nalpha-methyltransferase